jgi:drug/metabolite transporter (DMT)-like permease
MTNQRKAMLAALIGNVIFGFSFLASKVALNQVTPLVLLTARFALAFIILNLLVILGLAKINFKRKNVKSLILLGVIQPVIYFLCENYGIQYTTSSFSGVMIALVPVVAFF